MPPIRRCLAVITARTSGRGLLLALTLAGLAILLALAAPSASAATVPARTAISAHRGGAGQWPQDSLTAFSHALAAGYDEIEADAWILPDGHHVIYHDATISATRCTGRYAGRDIWKLTYAQVHTIRCQGQPIPTQGQLLSLVAHSTNKRAVLRLETKTYPGQSAGSVSSWAHYVGKQVVDAHLSSRVVMEDFDWNGIGGYHLASRSLRVSALATSLTPADIDRAAQLGAYDVSYEAQYATAALNSYITARHLVPTVWNVDAVPAAPGTPSRATTAALESRFTSAICSGVRVVITNYPALLSSYRTKVRCSS